jgi:hypothetical protein
MGLFSIFSGYRRVDQMVVSELTVNHRSAVPSTHPEKNFDDHKFRGRHPA